MNILTQLIEILNKNFKQSINNCFSNIKNPYTVLSFKQLTEEFDFFSSSFSLEAYQTILLSLDEEFMNSYARKRLYDSKGFITKSLLTKFGFIYLKRRRYVRKDTKESFIFLDRFLGLQKYSRLDPFVISELVDYSSYNSYSKAGKLVSNTIGTKIKYDNDINKNLLGRATTRNNVLKASSIMEEEHTDFYREIEELNVLLDEKYVGSQFNDEKDHMIKGAALFEGYKKEYKTNKRTRLTHKKVFGSINDDLLPQILDYIYYNYDTDKLKRINFMGDGALWIKSFALDSSFKYNKNVTTLFGLDSFHLSQAIQHITTREYKDTYASTLKDYVYYNKKDDFIAVVKSLIELCPDREDTITNNMNYILNNWNYIQNTFHNIKYKCSMESNISHVFADIFTSRPKAYSKKGLKALLKIRLLKINGSDLKQLYFHSLYKHSKIHEESLLDNRLIINNIDCQEDKYYKYFTNSTNTAEIIQNKKITLNNGKSTLFASPS